MAVDPRQVLGAFLTLTMFAMLSNMIKRDYFDSSQVGITDASSVQFNVIKVEEKDLDNLPSVSKGPWKERDPELKACWIKPALKEVEEESKGYITFSLTNGPEYHVSQVAAAVIIARYLGATLVLPEIRGSELGRRRDFEDVYVVEKLMKSLDGVIRIVKEPPAEIETERPAVVKVPNRVTEDYIRQNIEPVFQSNSYLRLAVFFPSTNLKKYKQRPKEFVALSCLASFGALELKPEIQEVADSMVKRLQALSQKSDGHFVAVDLRLELLDMKGCQEDGTSGRKSCYNAQEIGEFLRKLGFGVDTTIYLTQTWWHERLNVLKEMFPKSYTKDDIIPAEKKGKFLGSGSAELEKVLDFYICSQSDVFVPAISGLFYGNVVGKRIALGRTQILVPHQASGASSSPSEFISSYVSKRRHMAYSCYC